MYQGKRWFTNFQDSCGMNTQNKYVQDSLDILSPYEGTNNIPKAMARPTLEQLTQV